MYYVDYGSVFIYLTERCASYTHQIWLICYRKLYPRGAIRSSLLSSALSRILWRCGEGRRAVLALPSDSTMITGGGRYKSDGITETVRITQLYVPNFLLLINFDLFMALNNGQE